MNLSETVEKLKKYGIETTEKELLEKERQRLIKSLRSAWESGYLSNVNTALRELETLEENEMWERGKP